MKTRTFSVSGMHCVSCEILLEEAFSEVSGVKKVKISHKTGKIEIETHGNISETEIQEILNRHGYQLLEPGNAGTKKMPKISVQDFGQILGIFVGFLILFAFLSRWEISKFFPDLSETASFGIALLIGVVASVSTCLALTGGLVIGFSNVYKTQNHTFMDRAQPQIFFHMGRIFGFFILGGLLGLLGEKINYSVSFTGYLTIFVAAVMFYMALQILNFVPNISQIGFHLPKFFATKIKNISEKKSPFVPAIVGILTFFLPCGFTQSMQIAAVASGNFWTGAMLMMFFAIGTLPVLFLVGVGSSYAQNKDFGFLKKIIGVLVFFFALYSLNSGLVLSGANFTIDFWKPKTEISVSTESKTEPKTEQITQNSGEIQVVKMDVDNRFSPTEFRIKKGIPVRWEINGINISGCTSEVIIPRLDISSGKLKKGLNIVEFTPTESGILPFSCWMGMQGGKFIVE